jgi:hypothetical protein
MMNKSDPLTVLMDVKSKLNLNVDEDLIKECYQMQSDHQFDKNRDTMKQMQALIETEIQKNNGDMLL